MIYVSCACYCIFENRPLPFVAARQLMEFLCSNFYDSGTLLQLDQLWHTVLLMCHPPIGVVTFLV